MRLVLVGAVALVLATGACSASDGGIGASATPSPDASPPASQTSNGGVTAADLAAVESAASVIFPASGRECAQTQSDLPKCPFTPRLLDRLQHEPTPHADPLCRCQNTYGSRKIKAEAAGQKVVAHVALTFADGSLRSDWVFVKTAGKWLADDSYCTVGGPSTSIYAASPGPCSSP